MNEWIGDNKNLFLMVEWQLINVEEMMQTFPHKGGWLKRSSSKYTKAGQEFDEQYEVIGIVFP